MVSNYVYVVGLVHCGHYSSCSMAKTLKQRLRQATTCVCIYIVTAAHSAMKQFA